jgi:hypothetical protein
MNGQPWPSASSPPSPKVLGYLSDSKELAHHLHLEQAEQLSPVSYHPRPPRALGYLHGCKEQTYHLHFEYAKQRTVHPPTPLLPLWLRKAVHIEQAEHLSSALYATTPNPL